MTEISLNYLSNKSYSYNNIDSTTKSETNPPIDLNNNNISEKNYEKDSLKINLLDKQPVNIIKTEFGFIDILSLKEIVPESKAQANIIDCDPEKHVSSNNADFFYINGIMTTPEDARKTANILSEITDKKVESLWSEKKGFVNDLIKALKIDFGNAATHTISPETSKEIISKVIKSLESGKNVKIMAHSRGASETANALWDVRSNLAISEYDKEKINEMMGHIEVVTLGGLAQPSDFPSDVKLTQIKNPNDPVPKLIIGKDKIRYRYSKTELSIEEISENNENKDIKISQKVAIYKEDMKNNEVKTNDYLNGQLSLGINAVAMASWTGYMIKTAVSGSDKVFFTSINPKTLAKTAAVGAIVVGAGVLYTLKKSGSTHLINSGDYNYLGEKRVQDELKKLAN